MSCRGIVSACGGGEGRSVHGLVTEETSDGVELPGGSGRLARGESDGVHGEQELCPGDIRSDISTEGQPSIRLGKRVYLPSDVSTGSEILLESVVDPRRDAEDVSLDQRIPIPIRRVSIRSTLLRRRRAIRRCVRPRLLLHLLLLVDSHGTGWSDSS